MTTLAPLQPWCTDRYRTPQFDPQFPCGKPPDETVDAVRFLRPDDPGAGPFTDRASLEGATDFWIEVSGNSEAPGLKPPIGGRAHCLRSDETEVNGAPGPSTWARAAEGAG